MIPPLDADGRLPPGRHACTLAEIFVRFVMAAPNRQQRMLIFSALAVYRDLVRRHFPGATLWIDGGFVTHKSEAPKDVDVVIVVNPSVTPQIDPDTLLPLLTLQTGVTRVFGQDVPFNRVQPMGGLVDGFLALTDRPQALAEWDNLWGSVKEDPNARKGYLEVTP